MAAKQATTTWRSQQRSMVLPAHASASAYRSSMPSTVAGSFLDAAIVRGGDLTPQRFENPVGAPSS